MPHLDASVHLDIEEVNERFFKNEDIQYVLWMPGGDVARLVWSGEAWAWTEPFETTGYADEKELEKWGGQATKIAFSINATRFRERGKMESVPHVYDRFGACANEAINRERTCEDEGGKLRVILSTRMTNADVAFGLHAYVRAPRVEGRSEKSWQWYAATVVQWSYLRRSPLATEMFMWSHARVEAEHDAHKERLVITTGSDFRLASSGDRKTLEECVRLLGQAHVMPEFDVMLESTSMPPDMLEAYGEEQNNARLATLNTALEGLPYDVKDVFLADDKDVLPHQFMGSSAQSWYYWDAPVMTEAWLLQRLGEVCWLRGNECFASYVDDVNGLLKGPWKQEHRKLLTDVVRVVTMHSTSSPYTEDKVYDSKWVGKGSDTYCSGLTVPGDCEDGAQAAYMIYMSILFGKWKSREARAIQKLAAYLGVPVAITGTSENPMLTPPMYDGGSHAFGAIIPFRAFVHAAYGPEAMDDALAAFKARFGFDAPVGLDACAVETTLYTTPLVAHHESHPASEASGTLEKIVRNQFGETRCAWRNVAHTYVLDAKRACHGIAFKAFTTAHRELLHSDPKFAHRLRTLEGKDATPESCTFVFARAGGGVGVKRPELYLLGDAPPTWTLRVPWPMSEEVFKADVRLVRNARQPVVKLVSRHVDPQKIHGRGNAAFIAKYRDEFDRSAPHLVMFIYDTSLIPNIEDELEEARRELGALSFVACAYDKSVAVIFVCA